MTEDFDHDYKRISEEINQLNKAKLRLIQEKKQTDGYEEQLDEIESTIRQ